jgi:hypothetical protein
MPLVARPQLSHVCDLAVTVAKPLSLSILEVE